MAADVLHSLSSNPLVVVVVVVQGRQEGRDGTRMFSFSPQSFVGPDARYVSLARSDLAAVI